MYWRDMLLDYPELKFSITDQNLLGDDSASSVIHDPGRIAEMTIDNPGYSHVKKVFRAKLYPPILGQQVQTLNNLGALMNEKGDNNVAIAAYNQVLRLAPNNPDCYSNRGNAYRNKGNYDQAIADYNKAIELDPNDPKFYNNRGNAYRNKGNYDQAIANYIKALALDGRYDNAWHNLRITLQNVDDALVVGAWRHDPSLLVELSQRYPMNSDA
jgi:tetratricopeptide (TPR) repeat protein